MSSHNTYVLLGSLLPWTWGISPRLFQQSEAAAPYLGRGLSFHSCSSWPWTWSSSSQPSCAHAASAHYPTLGVRGPAQENLPHLQVVKYPPAKTLMTWVSFLGWEDPLEDGMAIHFSILAWKIPWTEEPLELESVGSQRVGHNWSDWAQSLWYFSKLNWKIPWTEEPGRLQSMGLLRVGHDWVPSLSLFTFMHWRRKWQPTPVFLPGESQGQGSLVSGHLWGRTQSDMTEAT